MRFLCVCHVVTPYLAPILQFIASHPEYELLLAYDRNRKENQFPGSRAVKLKHAELKGRPENIFGFWQFAIQNGRMGCRSLQVIADSGFIPDIIMLAPLAGVQLGIQEIFPASFRVAYIECITSESEAENAFRRQIREFMAINSELTFTFGGVEKNIARLAKPGPLAVNTEFFNPAELHSPTLAKDFPKTIFCLKGINNVTISYWLRIISDYCAKTQEKSLIMLPNVTWLRSCQEYLRHRGLLKLVGVVCNLPEMAAREMLEAAELFVYPADFVMPELLQAMSMGLIICSRQINDILVPDFNCLELTDWQKANLHNLQINSASLKENARETAVSRFAARKVVPEHIQLIRKAMTEKGL